MMNATLVRVQNKTAARIVGVAWQDTVLIV
jgi:hypothetical protein